MPSVITAPVVTITAERVGLTPWTRSCSALSNRAAPPMDRYRKTRSYPIETPKSLTNKCIRQAPFELIHASCAGGYISAMDPSPNALSGRSQKAQRKDFTNARAHTINAPMDIRLRSILLVAPVALASVSWLSHDVIAADFEQARVTQVVQDVKVMPSGAAARPAAVNETVQQGSAVQTGVQSRSELTFKDQTITRLGEKTIFNVGGQGRTIELGSGQFLLYVPKKAGGAKIKMGAVTAAITGTTVLGNVDQSGVVEFTVLEGTACIHLDRVGQSLLVPAGYMV